MKNSFTLLELVIVLVTIGIIATASYPRYQEQQLVLATSQIVDHIRYTQHLALTDHKFDIHKREYYKGRWQIVFSKSVFTDNQPAYTIFSDHDFGRGYSGDPTKTEIAKSPLDRTKLMTGGYGRNVLDIRSNSFLGDKKLNVGKTYGITKIKLSGGCRYARISFDKMGRPFFGDPSTMTGPYSARTNRLIQRDCLITVYRGSKSKTIIVTPETGYVHTIN